MLNSTFASLADTVAWHYPVFPFRYFLWDGFPSVRRIPRVTCPLLQFHGTDDDIVPYEQGQALFAAAPKSSVSGIANRFITIEGGRHNFITVGMMPHGTEDAAPVLRGHLFGSQSRDAEE